MGTVSGSPSFDGQLYLAPTAFCHVRIGAWIAGSSDFSREARNPCTYVKAPNLQIWQLIQMKINILYRPNKTCPRDGCGLGMTG